MENRTLAYCEDLLPWTLTIQPLDHTSTTNASMHCPSEADKILSFVTINVVAFPISLSLGGRDVVAALTCDLFGDPASPWWPLVSLCAAGLNLLANYINALSVQRLTGYTEPPAQHTRTIWVATSTARTDGYHACPRLDGEKSLHFFRNLELVDRRHLVRYRHLFYRSHCVSHHSK